VEEVLVGATQVEEVQAGATQAEELPVEARGICKCPFQGLQRLVEASFEACSRGRTRE
jgi:hypothetical protein